MTTAPISVPASDDETSRNALDFGKVVPLPPRRQSQSGDHLGGPERHLHTDLPLAAVEREVRGIVRSLAQAAIEVLAGTRPIQQLSRTLSQECFRSFHNRVFL